MNWRYFNKGDIDDGHQMPKRWRRIQAGIRRAREKRFWKRHDG